MSWWQIGLVVWVVAGAIVAPLLGRLLRKIAARYPLLEEVEK